MPIHIQKEPSAVRKMRSMTAAAAFECKGSPVNRLFSVMHDTSVFAQQYVKDSTTKHRKQKQTFLNKLRQSDRFLGINQSPAEVDAVTNPMTREQRRRESQKMPEPQDKAQLRRLIQAEQDRWARDRSLAEYASEGSCSRAFFEDIKKARVHSHIEKLKEGYTKIEDILRGVRVFRRGRKHL